LNKLKKILTIIALIITILVFINNSLWSIFPDEGLKRAEFYSIIKEPEYFTLNWIKNKTPEDSILVADHLYGWWLSGIAERTTLSAAGLEFLIYSHELEVAKNAQLLLDTDYYIDNGLIQIRDDGPYLSRHNPLVSIKKWTGESFPIFQFNEPILEYKEGNSSLSSMLITGNSIEQNQNLTIISTRYLNELFKIKKMLYLEKEKNYTEILYEIESINSQINDFNASFNLLTTAMEKMNQIIDFVTMEKSIIANDSCHKLRGQVRFEDPQPEIKINNEKNYAKIIFQAEDKIKIEIIIEVKDSGYPKETEIWNYKEMIRQYNVSHVVCRDPSVFMKFANDPKFNLLFNCGQITLFKVIE
jgi:hypothetical protein